MDNKKIMFAICDDSKKDREKLIKLIYEYIDKNNIYADVDEFASGEDLLKSDFQKYDIIFLDIFMDNIDGIEVAKILKKSENNINIVFTTISDDFASESYDVSALYYMIKPVNKKKLFLLMDNFLYAYYSVRFITVKVGRMETYISLDDIIFVEASGKKSIIHTKKGPIESSTSLAEMNKILLKPDFIKPIRYAIVSVREIVNIPTNVLLMSDGTEIPISRNERDNIKKAFCDYKWKKMREWMAVN
ncbi:LytTR family DNA-binding domain-containing protein [Clostridium sp. AL.422]|uniref:LytR/AlgR family response regulator transcription factor n=1 Tax=Clostridium TaxID=1485 RepID=UPI00293DFC98|nr:MULTISPECIES: LytTR family DNA-binding domain-containing protein [unclassified Clostridium]MDV4150135.1 LytTR family DNA-binding domain-containing protein [Clostridium sp. AL.422]